MKVSIELDEHDLPVVVHALTKSRYVALLELRFLKIAKDRDLTLAERAVLPENLQHKTREELVEQIDPWITLVDTIEDLIKKFST